MNQLPATQPQFGLSSSLLKYFTILVGPLLGATLYYLLHYHAGVEHVPSSIALLAVWMAAWWMTEAVPMELTSLLPIVVIPFTGLYEKDAVQRVCAPYADKTVFFFLGGFALGIAIEKTALHRRGALFLLKLAGSNGMTVVGAFMLATAIISMWVNNTATTVLMLPLATSIIATQPDKRFATCLLLGVGYAASLGGMATLVGTAPNVFFAGFMERQGMPIGFLQWMAIAMPIAFLLLFACWIWLTVILWPIGSITVRIPEEWTEELTNAPKLSIHQKWTLVIFFCAAFVWIFRDPLAHLADSKQITPFSFLQWFRLIDDAWVAIATMVALMFIPIRDPILVWKDIERIPWGVLILFGGGLSLSEAIKVSTLDSTVAQAARQLGGFPTWLVVMLVVIGVIAVSELASNVATATTLLPILVGIGPAIGVDTVSLMCATALAASCGFMLPVATPPNTIVFAQKQFPVRDMLLAGFGLNLMCVVAITVIVLWIKPLVMGSIP